MPARPFAGWYVSCFTRPVIHEVPELAQALGVALIGELDATLDVVADEAEDAANRVHSARKHLKRWRALFRLLPKSTRVALRREAHISQMVARKLGRVRDSVARLETWRQFVIDADLVDGAHVVSELLEANCAQEAAPSRMSDRLAQAGRALRRVRQTASKALAVKPAHAETGSAELASRCGDTYARGRRALRAALECPDERKLHALRRASKAHQYQLQFLEPAWPKPLKAQRSEVSELTELLGSHRDLYAVLGLLGKQASDGQLGCVLRLEARIAELQRAAFRAARLIYAERPAAFQRRITRYIKPHSWANADAA